MIEGKCAQCNRTVGDRGIKVITEGFQDVEMISVFCSYQCLKRYISLRMTISDFTEFNQWFVDMMTIKPPGSK